jgi:glucose-1-phosphatase
MTELKAIIFDLGKVVFDLSFDRVFESWATSTGKPFDDIKIKFVFDELFDKFEKSEISEEQFREVVSQRLGFKLSDEDFDKGWCDLYLDVYNNIDNLLIGLKRNYKLIGLTNTNAIHNKVWTVKYADTLRHFEKIFSSHELATRKPERKIFEIALDYLKSKPEQTLFLDDNLDNINGAKEIGINTILVTSNAQMMKDISRLTIIE